MGPPSASEVQRVPFGIGWRSPFNYSFARLLDGGEKILKRKDFAFDFYPEFWKKEFAKFQFRIFWINV